MKLSEAVAVARELVADLRKVADGARRFDPAAEATYLRRAEAVDLLIAHAEAPPALDLDVQELLKP